jgi:hypothetical protein
MIDENKFYYWVGQNMEILAKERGYKDFNDCKAQDPKLSQTIAQQSVDTMVGIYKEHYLVDK